VTTKVTKDLIDNTGLDSETVGGLVPASIAAPIGSIMMWPLDTIHDDYYEMNGDAKDTTTDADLFAVIGYTYGGSGSSFNLPDYRGYFPRGKDSGATNDPDAGSRTDRGDGTTGDVVGSKQDDAFQGHGHNVNTSGAGGSLTANATTAGGAWKDIAGTPTNLAGHGTARKSSETRSKNVSVVFGIKYK